MHASLLQFAASAAIIVVAGGLLTRYTDRIAELSGLGRSLAGMSLLAAATSLPELTVGCNAAWIGAGDLVAGELLGSCLMNLLLLAVLDMTHYSRGAMLSAVAAAHALAGAACILLTAVVLLFILVRPAWSLFGLIGVEFLVIGASYVFLLHLVYVNQRVARGEANAPHLGPPPIRDRESAAVGAKASYSLSGAVVRYLIAAAAVFAAAPFLAQAADRIAEETGLGETFIGTTLVALSTSLPEVVTTLTAVRMKAFDLAIGNIFGSNVFNLLIFAPVDLFQSGPFFHGVSATHAVTAAWIIIVTAVAMMGQLYRVEKRWWIVEPDAALVILLVLTALVMVYVLGS